MVLYAADAGRQLEPSCQRPSADALVDLGHMQRQLYCALALVGRCNHAQPSYYRRSIQRQVDIQ